MRAYSTRTFFDVGERVVALVEDAYQESFGAAVVVAVAVDAGSVCVRWDGRTATQWTPIALVRPAAKQRLPTTMVGTHASSARAAAAARFAAPPPPAEAAQRRKRGGIAIGARIFATKSGDEPHAAAVVLGRYPCGDVRLQWTETGSTERVKVDAVAEVAQSARIGASAAPSDAAAARRAAAAERDVSAADGHPKAAAAPSPATPISKPKPKPKAPAAAPVDTAAQKVAAANAALEAAADAAAAAAAAEPQRDDLGAAVDTIFADGDRDEDGVLSAAEISQMLKRRSKKTPLHGNSMAIFAFKSQLQERGGESGGEGGSDGVDAAVFEAAVRSIVAESPKSDPIAQWIAAEVVAIVEARKEREAKAKAFKKANKAIITALFGEGKATMVIDPQTHLQKLFQRIFAQADSEKEGSLSQVSLMNLLKKRAKKTPLEGNPAEMFNLRTLIEKQDAHGVMTLAAFEAGLREAIVVEPKGAVAQWIVKELQGQLDSEKKVAQRLRGLLGEKIGGKVGKKKATRNRRSSTAAIASLFGSGGGGGSGGASSAATAQSADDRDAHLRSLFRGIFTATDVDGDGTLDRMEIMNMLKKRAKGTPLDGNPAEMFSLISRLTEHCVGEEIDIKGFVTGMRKEFVSNARESPIAQWLQKEIADQARREKRKSRVKSLVKGGKLKGLMKSGKLSGALSGMKLKPKATTHSAVKEGGGAPVDKVVKKKKKKKVAPPPAGDAGEAPPPLPTRNAGPATKKKPPAKKKKKKKKGKVAPPPEP